MLNRKYNNKKKASPGSLINFEDFVKYRNDKEKIISNPFEQNWKKAIVFQQLFQLYKPQQTNFSPNTTNYDRKDFQNFYKHTKKYDEENSIWQNNEDYQLNKLYKMSEGINNYEEQFQNHKINKIAQKVKARDKSHRHLVHKELVPQVQKEKQLKKKCFKQSKIYFRKQNMKQFEHFLDFKENSRRNFCNQKGKIQKLKKKAVEQYGVVFKQQGEKYLQLKNYAEYKEKEEAIFQKFIKISLSKQTVPKEAVQSQKSLAFEQISNIPASISKHLLRPNTSCPTSPNNNFRQSSKTRYYSKKIYFRIPAVQIQ